MNGTIDDRYFEWLYSQFGAVTVRNPARSYWGLARLLYSKEFVWLVPNDDNRVEDGKELRYEFMGAMELNDVDKDWLDYGCSMLEMLIALARRLSFESDKREDEWFWILIENMGIKNYKDNELDDRTKREIDEILDRVIFRNYTYDGIGGLFPQRNASTDQRKVELWYQMSEYLLNESLH